MTTMPTTSSSTSCASPLSSCRNLRSIVTALVAVSLCCQEQAYGLSTSSKFSFFQLPTEVPANFPFGKSNKVPSSAELIEAAKKVMDNQGYFDPLDPSLFAEDFVFRGPVIGPLNKKDYIQVLDYFSIYKAFPDIDPNCFGYTVDPEDPYRVWFFLRATGTYQKPLGGPLGKLIQPDNQMYRGSLETWSLTFDDNLKCRLMTAGYVSDRFDEKSTTDGVGLSFGILQTLGLSLPSGVGNVALRLIQAINGPLVQLGLSPKAVSDPSEVPEWWTSKKRGADP